MAAYTFVINNYDFSKIVPREGMTIEENDIDSEESGRLLSGILRRDRIIILNKISINNIPEIYNTQKTTEILNKLRPMWVNVSFNSLSDNSIITRRFYCSRRGAVPVRNYNNDLLWKILPFNLIEEGTPGYA